MKKWVSFILMLMIVFSLAACSSSSAGQPVSQSVLPKTDSIMAKIAEDGTAYLPLMNGTATVIKGNVVQAGISPDRQHIVVLERDGQLYTTDPALSTKTVISEEALTFLSLENSGFIYIIYDGKDAHPYRCFFADGETSEPVTLALGDYDTLKASNNSLSLLLRNDDTLYVLPEAKNELEKVTSSSGQFDLKYISADGEFFAWSLKDGGTETYYTWENGERERICEFDNSYSVLIPNEAETGFIVTDISNDTIYIKYRSMDVLKVRLGGEFSSAIPYTDKDYYLYDTGSKFPGVYVLVKSSSNSCSLYWITPDGDREKLVSELPRSTNSFMISNNMLFYSDLDQNLFRAKVENGKMAEAEKIASDAEIINAANGNLYYARNVEKDGLGSLYVLKAGAKEPVRIASEVYSDPFTFTVSADGKTIWFFKDVELLPTTDDEQMGTLYSYTLGAEESVRVSSDVIVGSLTSGLQRGNRGINANSYLFSKLNAVEDETLFADWVYSDGTETTTIARNVHNTNEKTYSDIYDIKKSSSAA